MALVYEDEVGHHGLSLTIYRRFVIVNLLSSVSVVSDIGLSLRQTSTAPSVLHQVNDGECHMTVRIPIRILDANIRKSTSNKERTILRGVIHPESLSALQVDDYQREAQQPSSLMSIIEALEEGEPLQNLDLGMRGEKYQIRDGIFYLQDPTFIIDGLQRVTATKLFMADNPDVPPAYLGVTIYFNTTHEWEREMFITVNTRRRRVSPDKIMFNRRETSEGVGMLYKLCSDPKFALQDKVAWSQNKGSKFVGAFSLCKLMCVLHVHKVNGLSNDKDVVCAHLDRILGDVGVGVMRDNVRLFFDLIDSTWGLRNLQHYQKAPHIKFGFLFVFARFLSDHTEFWRSDDKRLFVDMPLRKALHKFNVHEPIHANLCGASGKALDQLYDYLVDDFNKGKRGKRLRPRHAHFVSMASKDMASGAIDPSDPSQEDLPPAEAAE